MKIKTRLQRTILLLLPLLLLIATPTFAANDKSVIRIGKDITIDKGEKVRRVVAILGQITVHGEVDDGVLAIGGSVVLTKTAAVGGDVASVGGVIVVAKDAEIGGNLTEINSTNIYETLMNSINSEWSGWSWVFALISLSMLTVILCMALLTAALLPRQVIVVSEAISENTFKVILTGVLALIAIAPLALLLTISVIGIALIPLEVILVVLTALLGFIAVSRLIGSWALHLGGKQDAGVVRQTFWGLVIIWIIGWIPYLGWMIKAIAIVVGLGATLITRFGTHQGWKTVSPD
ncbi:MAG: bactofilin family protein [Syntrophales bacterium]